MPAGGFDAGVFALSETAGRRASIIIGIEMNLAALTKLRGFSVESGYGDAFDVASLNRLSALASFGLLRAVRLHGVGGPAPWLSGCRLLLRVLFKRAL